MDRRTFLMLTGAITQTWASPVHASGQPGEEGAIRATTANKPNAAIKAILFDAFPIFNPGNVLVSAERLFPGKGQELIKEWRTQQFEYTWLRNSLGDYADFSAVTSDSLSYASELLRLEMTELEHRQLVDAYSHLQAWPEVSDALAQLKAAGYRLGILSNLTPSMLQMNTNNCGLADRLDQLLSVDTVKCYKPAPRAYQLGMDATGLSKEEILFVAFAGWDAVGAKHFGYKTFWVNRVQAPSERLGVSADGEAKDLNGLLKYLNVGR